MLKGTTLTGAATVLLLMAMLQGCSVDAVVAPTDSSHPGCVVVDGVLVCTG